MLPVKRFIEFIEQNRLFTPACKILAAVSGGMDSVLMAHLLKAAGYNFAIAHCNFTLRGADADADEQFTRELAKKLGVNYYATRFATKQYADENKLSVQMAARDLRYQWFQQLSSQHGFDTIALAHHQNDTIETILLNLTRGTGIAGLHGILPQNGNLTRPMLFLSRDEIQSIITNEGLAYVEDASNASVKYARNKIRHLVVPVLKELNPNLEATFENNLRNFRDMELLLDMQVKQIIEELLSVQGDELRINIERVNALVPQRLLLYKLLQPYGFTETIVDDLIPALNKHAGRSFKSPGYLLVVDREDMIITPLSDKPREVVCINQEDNNADWMDYRMHILHDDSPLIIKDNPMAVSVDADKLVYPLTVRGWQQGDSFKPLGMRTRQKLSDFFVQQKVPLHAKNHIPLLVNGNGDIVWIGGYRLHDDYKVSNTTKKVTIFELYKI
ncbi:tRNA lysidine(34) synthetase TilS [Mucilaginibacter sp.]|uniref:tRNA lysidine(34) synthetase TilS n=1 Tax=Mucilaginibacter sp. TaxID=1882438 RepID=UPI000CB085B5|nr:tRNA lysidine(34) synthetase TilS [Mucilaginibacter sp.]PLW90083.1 MAG: tRNA lysidine(34) synthetase TilS [Mucilaginibacter sp.]HEK20340.1 tRNA lysidine(34) synthetase TilS [Bacteroidota bacterium]